MIVPSKLIVYGLLTRMVEVSVATCLVPVARSVTVADIISLAPNGKLGIEAGAKILSPFISNTASPDICNGE